MHWEINGAPDTIGDEGIRHQIKQRPCPHYTYILERELNNKEVNIL